MIEVRVGQYDSIQGGVVKRKGIPVALPFVLRPLKQTAVDQDLFGTHRHERAAAGYAAACCSEKT
jgi:hypothetical protein